MSRVLAPAEPIGVVKEAMAREWRLDPQTLLVAGTNDQYAGALGAGNCRPGILTETSGTCLALVTLTRRLPRPMPPGLLGGPFPVEPYCYALAYAKTAGVVLDWFQRELGGGMTLRQLDRLAARIPAGANGLAVLPHFEGMVSPVPDPRVRGVISGLALRHTRVHIYRAILEALAFALRENVEFLRDCGLRPRVVRSIGGGARSDLWLQIKADVLGVPVERPAVTEAAVMGAAMLAAVGCGDRASLRQASESLYRCARIFEPQRHNRAAYAEAYRRYQRLRESSLQCEQDSA
jgi:xylulokinase